MKMALILIFSKIKNPSPGFYFIVLCCLAILFPELISAGGRNKNKSCTSIALSGTACYIGRVSNDTLVIISGSTYMYSTDTQEDSGLVSTRILVEDLPGQLQSGNGSRQSYQVIRGDGIQKREGEILPDDRLVVTSEDGKKTRLYALCLSPMAVSGKLQLSQQEITCQTSRDITLKFTAGQRSPEATITFFIPPGIEVTEGNVTVNMIGRGKITLGELEHQSIGRVGKNYSYSKVGITEISKKDNGETILIFKNIDLRPSNGADIEITINDVRLSEEGQYVFKSMYTTSLPEKFTSAGISSEIASLTVKKNITDLERVQKIEFPFIDKPENYTQVSLKWTPINADFGIHLMKSMDQGKSWEPASGEINYDKGIATLKNLLPDKLYTFRLWVKDGYHKGFSNTVHYFSGKLDAKEFGIIAEDSIDNTYEINKAIEYIHNIGGGTLLLSKGIYCVRTVHLKSNVYLLIEKGAVIKAMKGSDEPESTWFSDRKYRSGLSPTDTGPYHDPENYLTKQDVGHSFFHNSMFFGERLDNVKIIGNGRITGNGNLNTSDKVMNSEPGNRADKMFSLKLCTHVEIGGIYKSADLWYDEETDEPYYLGERNTGQQSTANMLDIDRGGHFVLLATGCDKIYVHNTFLGRSSTSNVRDIYDFMGCNDVSVTNIYCKVSSDDIVKLGSDCSLGFTRPSKNIKIRNIIGDTNCNLFQIGSETADDITDVCVDNIYVLGANKAGFSISTNDGGDVKNIHLNCGHTGTIHSRSKMYRTTTPFFISISNRGRILGAEAARYKFRENGEIRDELLCTNVNIGEVNNIFLNGIDVFEVYAGSSFRGDRWKAYDGTQRKSTPIIAGYKLPEAVDVEGGLNFNLPNKIHTGYISEITFKDIHFLFKGGNPPEHSEISPKELGVGQYNVSNLGIQPSYGLWARHVKNLFVENCSFNYESRDNRYVIVLEDVSGAKFSSVKMVRSANNDHALKLINTSGVRIVNSMVYSDAWGKSPFSLTSFDEAVRNPEIQLIKRNF